MSLGLLLTTDFIDKRNRRRMDTLLIVNRKSCVNLVAKKDKAGDIGF